ncbi:MAG: ParA family protein [Pseudomonadota bacterium]
MSIQTSENSSKIIAVANQKGGVGKTTTSINLAASLAATKRRVLLFDLDPQGNATTGSGIDESSLEVNSYDVLIDDIAIADVKQPVLNELDGSSYDIVPTNGDLTAAEVELMAKLDRERQLLYKLNEIKHEYDYILIDCPPSLSMLTINAMVAADSVLIPMQCEYYALEGLTSLRNTIASIKKTLNPDLEIDGLLRTMYDPRNRLATEVSRQLIKFFGDKVFRTVIPRNVRLAEAPSHGLPIISYDKNSKGARSYLALAGEILRREEEQLEQT